MAQRMTIASEERVGSQSPCTFAEGQAVYLWDLHPNAASQWTPAKIVCKLGLLTYQVNTNGHLRQAYAGHLKMFNLPPTHHWIVAHLRVMEISSPQSVLLW